MKNVLIVVILCSCVELRLSLAVNKTAVCRKENEKGDTWIKCCPGYKLNDNDECTDCPLGTYGENCKEVCKDGYYGLRCRFQCNCTTNERCDKEFGCRDLTTDEKTSSDGHIQNKAIPAIIVIVLLVLGTGTAIFLWKKRIISCDKHLPNVFDKIIHRRRYFVQSRAKDNTSLEDEDDYSEIRESLMVRPMTAYGRQLSYIRKSENDQLDAYNHLSDITSDTSKHQINQDRTRTDHQITTIGTSTDHQITKAGNSTDYKINKDGSSTDYSEPVDVILDSRRNVINSDHCILEKNNYEDTYNYNKNSECAAGIYIENSECVAENTQFDLKQTDEYSFIEQSINNDHTNVDVEYRAEVMYETTESEIHNNDDHINKSQRDTNSLEKQ